MDRWRGVLTGVFVLAVLGLHGLGDADEGVPGGLWGDVAPGSPVTVLVQQVTGEQLDSPADSARGHAMPESVTVRMLRTADWPDVAPPAAVACLAILLGGLLAMRRPSCRNGTIHRRRDAGHAPAWLVDWNGARSRVPIGPPRAGARLALTGVMLT